MQDILSDPIGIKKPNNALSSDRGPGVLKTAAGIIIIAVFGGLLFYCAFLGLHTPDESFYLTVPYRVFLGDALIIDEWQESQFCSFLQYIPLAAFIKITGSTQGLILFFRLLFSFCQTLAAIFVFLRLKRFGAVGAVVSTLLFLMYVPEFVQGIDYYTISLTAFELIAVLLFTSDVITIPKGIFIGVLSACAVVAQPFNAFVYFVFTAAVLVFFLIRKKRTAPHLLSVRVWGGVTAGVFLTAAAFFAFLLSRASLSEYLANIGNLFSGYNHILPFSGAGQSNMLNYGVILRTLFGLQPVGLVLSAVLTVGLLADKRRVAHRAVWGVIVAAFGLYYVISTAVMLRDGLEQALFSPYIIFVLTLHCWLLTEKRNARLLGIWCAGLVYMICLGAVSRALNYVGVIGCVVSNTAFGPVLQQLFSEIREKNSGDKAKIIKIAANVVAAVLFLCSLGVVAIESGALAVSNRADMYLEMRDGKSDVKITGGPLKGIYVGEEEKNAYDMITADLKKVSGLNNGRVYVEGGVPWAYLMFDSPPGTCSAWNVGKAEMLAAYYEKYPDRVAKAVYAPFIDLFKKDMADFHMEYNFIYSYKQDPYFKDYSLIKGSAGYILYGE